MPENILTLLLNSSITMVILITQKRYSTQILLLIPISTFFLKDAPLDLVDWRIDNGKREDLNVVRKPILETLQVDESRPPSEYHHALGYKPIRGNDR